MCSRQGTSYAAQSLEYEGKNEKKNNNNNVKKQQKQNKTSQWIILLIRIHLELGLLSVEVIIPFFYSSFNKMNGRVDWNRRRLARQQYTLGWFGWESFGRIAIFMLKVSVFNLASAEQLNAAANATLCSVHYAGALLAIVVNALMHTSYVIIYSQDKSRVAWS